MVHRSEGSCNFNDVMHQLLEVSSMVWLVDTFKFTFDRYTNCLQRDLLISHESFSSYLR
ncbi:MAG: hypothetical protein JWN75_874 [Candidatus Saccharibacteria bacterium]|nr:hypothetical protein [Candidatus Saccharibacteria bacterium]